MTGRTSGNNHEARLSIIFYHPKNPSNIIDAALIAESVAAPLYIVERPGTPIPRGVRGREGVKVVKTLVEAVQAAGSDYYVVLETYGYTCVDELVFPHGVESVALVVGAEDYGLPLRELEKLPGDRTVVAKIPVGVEGSSYNAVFSMAVGIHYVLEALEGERAEPMGRYNLVDFLFK